MKSGKNTVKRDGQYCAWIAYISAMDEFTRHGGSIDGSSFEKTALQYGKAMKVTKKELRDVIKNPPKDRKNLFKFGK